MNRSELHLRVAHIHELRQVLTLPASGTVVLDAALLPVDEAQGWEREINRLLRTCGCDEATVALLLNFGVLAFAAWSHWDAITGAPLLSAVIGIGCSSLAVAAGKAVGKLRGRRRLAGSVERLRAVLERRRHIHIKDVP